jgi:hypothetical protein
MPIVFPTSPTVGQVFTESGRSWVWTGSTWDSPAGQPFLVPGATFLNKTSYTSQTSIIVDNVFSSQYDTYKIFIPLVGTVNGDVAINLRANGSDLSTSNYNTQIAYVRSTGFTAVRVNSQNVFFAGVTRVSGRSFVEITVNDPFKALPTNFLANGTEALDGISSFESWGIFTLTTSATGFKVTTPQGASTGEIQVFGLRNA